MDEKDFEAHLREHSLMTEAHRADHAQLAVIMKETADRLEKTLNITAERLARTVSETAELHWQNHLLQHQQNDRAVDKAQEATEARFASMDKTIGKNKEEGNEWRGAMDDREGKFASREQLTTVEKALLALNQWRDRTEGKSMGAAPMWALGATVITAVVVAVVVAFFTGR